jgi:hypothetical protein
LKTFAKVNFREREGQSMTGNDGYDAFLHFFGHIARFLYRGKEIGGSVICVICVSENAPYTDISALIGGHL